MTDWDEILKNLKKLKPIQPSYEEVEESKPYLPFLNNEEDEPYEPVEVPKIDFSFLNTNKEESNSISSILNSIKDTGYDDWRAEEDRRQQEEWEEEQRKWQEEQDRRLREEQEREEERRRHMLSDMTKIQLDIKKGLMFGNTIGLHPIAKLELHKRGIFP